MSRDRRDMELVDGGLLLAGLRAPVVRGGSKQLRARLIRGRRVEQQVLGEAAFLEADGWEALQLLGVDDGQIQAGLSAVVQKDGVDRLARGGRQAKETFEMPSSVFTNGRRCLIRRSASMVSTAPPM